MRFSPRAWKSPPYAQSDSQLETQDEDDRKTQIIQTIEDDGEDGISNLDDIDPTQSQ